MASDSTGQYLAAIVENGQVYTSRDYGVNWAPWDSDRAWQDIASNSNGNRLIASVYAGQLYTILYHES